MDVKVLRLDSDAAGAKRSAHQTTHGDAAGSLACSGPLYWLPLMSALDRECGRRRPAEAQE
jgi:hypothetical protein